MRGKACHSVLSWISHRGGGDEPGGRRSGLEAGSQIAKDFFQQGGVQQVLGLRKAARADWAGADIGLHARQLAGCAQTPHGADHRIEQAEKKEREIIGQSQSAFGVRPGGMR
jgi:hypothetical protein